MRPTIRTTHHGASAGERRVSHLEAERCHLTVEEVQRFLDVAPDHAYVTADFHPAEELGHIGKTRISLEWVQEDQ